MTVQRKKEKAHGEKEKKENYLMRKLLIVILNSASVNAFAECVTIPDNIEDVTVPVLSDEPILSGTNVCTAPPEDTNGKWQIQVNDGAWQGELEIVDNKLVTIEGIGTYEAKSLSTQCFGNRGLTVFVLDIDEGVNVILERRGETGWKTTVIYHGVSYTKEGGGYGITR